MLRLPVLKSYTERMKKIINMWRMTKDLEEYSNLKLKDIKVVNAEDVTDVQILRMHEGAFIQRFATVKKHSEIYAYGILEDCIEEGYIKKTDSVKPGIRGNFVRVTRGKNKGTDLIDTFIGFPIGLIETIWKKHGRYIAGILTGLVGAVIVALAKLVWHRHIQHEWPFS